MSQCCSISNPSSDSVSLLNQKCFLRKLAGDLVNPPSEHKCTMSICVSIDALDQSIKNLPNSFCFKVVIPDTNMPFPIDQDCPIKQEKPSYDTNPVAKSVADRYISDNTIVTVVDTTAPNLPSTQFMSQCIEKHTAASSSESDLLVFAVGKQLMPEEWSNGLSTKHTVLQYVDPNDILTILANSKRHILTGSLLGWWGAVLSESDEVVCPDPWTPGVPLEQLAPNTKWTAVKCGWNYTRFFDQVYYINLDRRSDRREHMDKQLRKFGLSANRVAAVDGKNVQWKPEYGVISNYWNNGAFAYCLSYRVAIVDAMKKGYDNVLILDDDCVFQDNMWEILEKAQAELPEDWHMLYFGANHGHPQPVSVPTEQDRIGDHIYKLKGSMGSHAIILNKACFQTVLNYLAAPYGPLDMFFSMYQKFFPCYITYPGLASQLAGVSDIINKEVNYTKDWGVDYINHIPSRVSN